MKFPTQIIYLRATAFHSLPALLLTAGILASCMTGGDGVETEPEGLKKEQGTYRIVGGKIINENRFRLRIYCSDTGLVTEPDTLESDTISFELAGNTLRLFNPHADSTANGAVVQDVLLAARVGSGSSLIGLWQYTQQTYQVTKGTLSDSDKTRIEKEKIDANAKLALTRFQVRFAGGLITTFEVNQTAQEFLLDWNDAPTESPEFADSARYAVEVKVTGMHEVQLKGRVTGETVRLTLENDRSETYHSSDPGHAAYRYYRTPTSCPNELEPSWYRRFLDDNLKTSEEIALRY